MIYSGLLFLTLCALGASQIIPYKSCNFRNPCTDGRTCAYGRQVQGMKTCFMNVPADNDRSSMRCPTKLDVHDPFRSDFFQDLRQCSPGRSGCKRRDRTCNFNGDCLASERCCELITSGSVPKCVTGTPLASTQNRTDVITLISGSSNTQFARGYMEVLASAALVRSKGKNILFDTGNAYTRQMLQDSLKDLAGLYPEDIDYVVTSHQHPDHYMGVDAFPDVPNYVAGNRITAVDDGAERFTFQNFIGTPYPKLLINNDPNVEIVRTPGHTMTSDMSVIVKNTPLGTVAMVGDLFLDENDFPISLAEDPNAMDASRKLVVCTINVDYIFPGHGPMFAVTPSFRNKVC